MSDDCRGVDGMGCSCHPKCALAIATLTQELAELRMEFPRLSSTLTAEVFKESDRADAAEAELERVTEALRSAVARVCVELMQHDDQPWVKTLYLATLRLIGGLGAAKGAPLASNTKIAASVSGVEEMRRIAKGEQP